jgi:UDP-N-acetylglucosamine 2-epimerase (non-hydrolysing)
LRENTERPETIDVGANVLVGTDPERILDGALEVASDAGQWDNPFGDGTASEQILRALGDQ